MKIVYLLAAPALMLVIGCEDSHEPPAVETFSGELEVEYLQPGDPDVETSIDTVIFTVEGKQYRLDHAISNSGLCSSGGTVGNFGSNLITLTPVFTIPMSSCDSIRIPQGEIKASFSGDSLLLGPDTIEFDTQGWTETRVFTFRLTR